MALSPVPRQDTLPSVPASGAVARLRDLTGGFTRFTEQPAVRRALPSIILVAATALALLAWLALRETPRSTLYPGMAEAEKARVIETLGGSGIEARVDRTSGEITVPSSDYHRARLALAAQGLPQSVPDGDRVLSDLPMGASRALETARLRQAQELDLARSITEIASVQAARVHLALPEKSAFLRDSLPPRASVFLTLAAGRVMAPGQVEAIVHLVSSSVSGLAQSDVTVVDQTGRLLSRGDMDDAGRLSERQLRHRVEVENLMRQRIEALLTPVVGQGNLSVEVTASMDFTRREITEERVDPEGNALRSEQLTDTLTRDAAAGGIPGAVANTPPPDAELADAPVEGGETDNIRNRTTGSTRNYEISRTVASTQEEIGKITRVYAAIVIRAPAKPAVADGATADAPAIPDTLIADLQRLAETAIGYDSGRGDSVTILAQPFAHPEEVTEAPGMNLDWIPGALREFALIAIVAVVGLGVVRPLLMRQTQPAARGTPLSTYESARGIQMDDLEGGAERRQKELAISVLGNRATREEKQAVLRSLVADDPVRIATVMHRMMKSDLDSA
jgi:flagellar M-ring protein FliF